jgi:RNA polymerase sigma-70 factor (ECF subfamily)
VNSVELDKDQALRLLRERIFRYAASRVSREVADDLAQTAMMILERKYSSKDAAEEILRIAIGIMKRLLQAQYRTGKIEMVAVESATLGDDSPDPEQQARFRQLQAKIMLGIEKLGGRCRSLFLLKLDGYGFEEIRQKMGANSIDTVYTWDFRCKRDLAKLLDLGGVRK